MENTMTALDETLNLPEDFKLVSFLPKDQKDAIRDYIGNYAGAGGESPNRDVGDIDYILRLWDSAKQDLYKVFKKNFILSKKVRFVAPLEELEQRLSEQIWSWRAPGREFYNIFSEKVADKFSGKPVSDDRPTFTKYDALMNMFRSECLIENVYDIPDSGDWVYTPSFTIPNPKNDKVIEINRGCKISKVLRKIAEAYDLDMNEYENFRNAHSLAINNKYLEGELCLSIHPLDYMTMSDNSCGWSSCMSWMESGDFRQGTVEMMNSPCVVVAYLKSEHSFPITFSHEWNSKKWRQLFVVSPEVIMGIRQYPYECDELRGLAINWPKSLAVDAGWGPYTDNACMIGSGDYYIAEIDKDLRFYFCTGMMYCDVCSGESHLAYVNKDLTHNKLYEIYYSGASECMVCGCDCSWDCGLDGEYSLECSACDGRVECIECGCRMNHDDAYWYDDNSYCHYCADNYIKCCPHCEENHHEGDMEIIYLSYEGKCITGYSAHICRYCGDCFDELKEKGVLISATWQDPHLSWCSREYYGIDIMGDEVDLICKLFDLSTIDLSDLRADCINNNIPL